MKIQKSVPTHQPFRSQQTGQEIFTYEAMIQLDCGQCGRAIEVGDLFSRSADKKGYIYGIRYTQCRSCIPFEPVLQDL